MSVVFVLMLIEWRFELWTPRRDEITLYRKPDHCSWFALNAKGKQEKIRESRFGDKE